MTLDGHATKPGKTVQPGARITIDLGAGALEVEVLDIPAGNIPKKAALSYYRIVRDERGDVGEWG